MISLAVSIAKFGNCNFPLAEFRDPNTTVPTVGRQKKSVKWVELVKRDSRSPVPAARFYIAPNGSDNNNGNIEHPFATLNKAWTVVSPGDLIYMRGGTYAFRTQQYLSGKSGTSNNLIKVWAYPGETPILTKGENYTHLYYRGGCYFSGDYVHFKGLDISGFTQENSHVWNGLLIIDSNHNIFERLNVHHNGGGLYIQGKSTNNLVLNSDFHHNYDPFTHGGNADGVDLGYIASGSTNTVRGCRAWWNSDDGFDTWSNDGLVVLENNWSWYNGYLPDTLTPSGNGTGFKLGLSAVNPTVLLRILRNNVAFKNREHGYDKNGAQVRMEFVNNIAYDNGGDGFHVDNPGSHTFKNNISYNNHRHQVIISAGSISAHNSAGGAGELNNWTKNVSDADFLSISPTGVDGARRSDGRLPALKFLHLAPTSDLISAGADVGLPYHGKAPNIGAF